MIRRSIPLILLVLLATSCGDGDVAGDATTTPTTTTTTAASTTTTSSTSTTTTTTLPPTPLEELGYPVSDDWVVETVVSGLDSGTGGLAIDADGVLYQGDFGYPEHVGDRVYRIDPDGTVETFASVPEMESLTMTTFGPDGTLYQSSYGSDHVFAISPAGEVEIIADDIRGPTGIVVLDDGTLVVESYDTSTLYRIPPGGEPEEWVFDRRFNGTNGLAIDPNGIIYVIDFKDGGLFSVDPEGTVEKIHKFPKPTSHGVYFDGWLYITSRGGYVVYRYEIATGYAEIIAGSGEPGESDGRGSESAFGRPNAITVTPDGTLYINHGAGFDNEPVTIKRITYSP